MGVLPTVQYFGCDVKGRSFEGIHEVCGGGELPGEPKITDLNHAIFDEDVGWLQITMGNFVFVEIGQCLEYLPRIVPYLFIGEPFIFLEKLTKVLTGIVSYNDHLVLCLHKINEPDDVLMGKLFEHLVLEPEPNEILLLFAPE